MSSIVKRKKGNLIYYYIVDSKREGKKVKHVNSIYIGNSNTLRENFEKSKTLINSKDVLYSNVLECGIIPQFHRLFKKLKIDEIINKNTSKRKQGVSIGELSEIAILNRIFNPTSKLQICDWYKNCILKEELKVDVKSVTSEKYSKSMLYLTDETIKNIEEELMPKIIKKYKVNTNHLIYDATNFFTFFSEENDSKLAQKGHSKEERKSNKIVGLSMFVTPDYSMPLMYDTYPGNVHDSNEFKKMLNELKERYENIFGTKTDITISFDRGNNCQEVIDLIADMSKDMHYVGGLRLSQLNNVKEEKKQLLEIPLEKYINHEKKENLKLYRSKMEIYGKEHVVLLMYDEKTYKKQSIKLDEDINKTLEEFQKLKKEITKKDKNKRGRKRKKSSTDKKIKEIMKYKEYVDKIVENEIKVNDNEEVIDIDIKINEEMKEKIKKKYLGKRALYTNRFEWSNEQIEATYSSSWHVEHGFRQMKDDKCISVKPMFHWKDERIKAHIFYCVMAYRLCCIMINKIKEDIGDISINKLIEETNKYKKVVTVSNMEIIESYTKVDERILKMLQKSDMV